MLDSKIVVPYFCVLREGYYVIIWPIVRICMFIKDWKLIYSEFFILKRIFFLFWTSQKIWIVHYCHVFFRFRRKHYLYQLNSRKLACLITVRINNMPKFVISGIALQCELWYCRNVLNGPLIFNFGMILTCLICSKLPFGNIKVNCKCLLIEISKAELYINV
jgi:hypothetical protein